jgi:dynactin complex subunit
LQTRVNGVNILPVPSKGKTLYDDVMHTGVMSTSADSKNHSLKNSGVNPEKTAESIKNIAKSIREASAKMRETVRTLRESGAIDDITQAVYEATVAARDTAKELNDAAKDLKERGIIKDTAAAVEQTTMAARDTAEILRDTARQTAEAAPHTTETVKEAASKVKSKTKHSGQS